MERFRGCCPCLFTSERPERNKYVQFGSGRQYDDEAYLAAFRDESSEEDEIVVAAQRRVDVIAEEVEEEEEVERERYTQKSFSSSKSASKAHSSGLR